MTQAQRIVVLVVASLGVACRAEHRTRLSLSAGGRLPSPAFVISAESAPAMIWVEASGRYPASTGNPRYWSLARVPGVAARADTIRYGVVPPGYAATNPAPLLAPGRYQLKVVVDGVQSVLYFRVRADGTVTG